MRSFGHLAVAAVLVAVATAPVAAQAHPLAGRWQIEFERGKRIENGEVTVIRGTATLTLELRGDSLVGTLERPASPEQPAPPPQYFAARPGAADAVFVVKTTVQMNMNGEMTAHEAVMTWTLHANGDALQGTMLRAITDADMAAEPTPVSGKRLR